MAVEIAVTSVERLGVALASAIISCVGSSKFAGTTEAKVEKAVSGLYQKNGAQRLTNAVDDVEDSVRGIEVCLDDVGLVD